MTREKQTRRMIAMALAAAVAMSSMPVVAFAETGESGTPSAASTESSSNESGSAKTETSTKDNGDGTTTATKTETTATGTGNAETGESGDNGSVETKTTATVTDEKGETVRVTITESKEETVTADDTVTKTEETTTTTTTPDAGDESGQPPVSVEGVAPGETGSAAAETTETTGDVAEGEDDTEYDYTETTETEREVELKVSEGETVTTETEGEKISASETDKEGILNETHEVLGGQDRFYESLRDGEYLAVQAGQGNFNGTNSGNISYYVLDKDGNVKLDSKGNPVLLEGRRGADIYQILVKDEDGNFHTVYGLKNGITTEGLSYDQKDLQDYTDDLAYGEDSVTAINSLAKYGYWGTDEGLGSLEKMQSEMKAAVKETEDGKYAIGGVTFESREAAEGAIDALNDGDAQLVTNAALWSFADGYADKEKVNDTDCGFGNYAFGDFVADGTDVATLQMMYQYLMDVANAEIEQSKAPVTAEEEAVTETKTETVVEDVTLKVYDKADGAESNNDDNRDNDVYNTDLSIKMVVTKDGTLKVYNGSGEQIASADISNSNGESTTVTFEGLTLAENEKVDIKLEHVEHMNAGVYVLEPTESAYDQFGAYGPMSPLVGLKTDTVTTTTSYAFEFNVDEDDKTVVKKSKRTTTVTKHEAPNGGNNGSSSTEQEPAAGTTEEVIEDISDADVPLTDLPGYEIEEPVVEDIEIGDEDVPLTEMVLGAEEEAPLVAGIPETGDNNQVMGFGAMALAALAGMFGLRKKEN